MGANTKIEWAHHTWNPGMGCTPVSEGCRNCYAAAHAMRFADQPGSVFAGLAEMRGPEGSRRPVFTGRINQPSRDYMLQPFLWNKAAAKAGVRHRVFCASMSDWLDPNWPLDLLCELLGTVYETNHLDWLLLTKRPENARKRLEEAHAHAQKHLIGDARELLTYWLDGIFPRNIWIGTTVENQSVAPDRLRALMEIPCSVRFVSAEPLLGRLDLLATCTDLENSGLAVTDGFGRFDGEGESQIHWVICGGESGPNARPMHPDHARLLRDQCYEAGVKFFFKQWGEHDEHGTRVGKKQSGRLLDGREWNEVPA